MFLLRFARNKPPLCAFQIKMRPFCLSQFTGTHNYEGSKAQSALHCQSALIAIHCAEQFSKPLRVRNCGKVDCLRYWCQCSAYTGRRVMFAFSLGDGESEDRFAVLFSPVYRLADASCLDAPKDTTNSGASTSATRRLPRNGKTSLSSRLKIRFAWSGTQTSACLAYHSRPIFSKVSPD